ncbi:MAG: type VI secretion system tip protein TssI/VgrG [Polyangiaceae bacterium]
MIVDLDAAPREEVHRLTLAQLADADLTVHTFHGTEELNKLYRFRIVVTSRVGLDGSLEEKALGHRAVLSTRIGRVKREFHGIIWKVEAEGRRGIGTHAMAQHQLVLVPRAWTLKKRKNTRFFQNMRVDQVIAAVLREARVPSSFRIERLPPVRKYITQFDETDWEFVSRLAAESGFFFFFAQPQKMPDETAENAAAAAAGLAALGSQQLGGEIGGVGGAMLADLGGAAAGALSALVEGEMLVFSDSARAYPALDDEQYDALDLAAAIAAETAAAAESAALAAAESASTAVGGVVPGASAVVSAGVEAGVSALEALLPRGVAPTLVLRSEAGALRGSEFDSFETFAPARALRATQAMSSEFDPDRPRVRYTGKARVDGLEIVSAGVELAMNAAADAVATALGSAEPAPSMGAAGDLAATALSAAGLGMKVDAIDPAASMELYEHHGRYLFPDARDVEEEARRTLKQGRRRARLAHGSSHCARACAGRRFVLAGHPIDGADGEYAFISVEHWGARGSGDGQDVYRNVFTAVPKDVAFVPRRPERRVVQNCLTAIVVGPPGEEIHVNQKGEIRVMFHWDRSGRGENSSCWIRTLQAWGGAGWGTQFIPRVGMEVVVTFDGGDPDRPLVLGSVYNGTHPPPFPLPMAKTRSGIKSSSTPGASGFNEISLDDTAGGEQVYIRAQRDFDIQVEHSRRAVIRVDDEVSVARDRRETIAHDQVVEVRNDSAARVHGNRSITVDGSSNHKVDGDARARVGGRASFEYGDDAKVKAEADVVLEVRGSTTAVVGRHDAPRSLVVRVDGEANVFSTRALELASDKEVILRCGKSAIHIGPERIELRAPALSASGDGARLALGDGDAKLKVGGALLVSGDKMLLKASGASLGLSTEAKIDGTRILLNSPTSASDVVKDETPPATHIELVDEDGCALPRQAFRIVLEDGSERTGTTDDDGKAELDLAASGKIFFSALPEVRKG